MPRPAARGRRVVREIRSTTDPAFGAAYSLLRRTFETAEMMPRRDWRIVMRERELRLWTDAAWHLLVAMRDGRVLGAASGSYLGNHNVGVIGYVAVVPAARSEGVGPRLRSRLLACFERDARRLGARPLRAVVGEVRADNPWLRRLVRTGALPLDLAYHQPSISRGRKPVPLVLYWQARPRPVKSVAASDLRRFLYTLWRRVYRVGSPLRDPVFRRMLRSLRGRRRIRGMSPDQLPSALASASAPSRERSAPLRDAARRVGRGLRRLRIGATRFALSVFRKRPRRPGPARRRSDRGGG